MKKESSLAALLGMSQDNIAMLIGISRGHFSMYELGLRSLPSHARLKLNEIVAHVRNPETNNKRSARIEPFPDGAQEKVMYLLDKNVDELSKLAKAIRITKQRNTTQEKTLTVTDFLSGKPTARETEEHSMISSIADKAKMLLETKGEALLFELEVKQEALQLVNKFLQTKLDAIKQTMEEKAEPGAGTDL